VKFINFLWLFAYSLVLVIASSSAVQATRRVTLEDIHEHLQKMNLTKPKNQVPVPFLPFRASLYGNEPQYSQYYSNRGISYIGYADSARPKVPLIEPDSPRLKGRAVNGCPASGIASIPIVAHAPLIVKKALPTSIKAALQGISDDSCIKIFLSIQDYPWEQGSVPYFRPHYATEVNALQWGYSKKRNVQVGLFNSENDKIFFEGQSPNQLINTVISCVPEDPSKIISPTIPKSSGLAIKGLRLNQSSSFWSYIGYKDDEDHNKNKAIITLHCILTDKQENFLLKEARKLASSPKKNHLESLIDTLMESTEFQDSGHLVTLVRPIWAVLEQGRPKKSKLRKQGKARGKQENQALIAQQQQKAAARKREELAAQQKAKALATQKKQRETAQKKEEPLAQQKAQALAAQQQQKAAAQRKAQLAAQQKAKALAAQQQQKAVAQRKAQLAAQQKAKALAAQQQQKAAARRKAQLAAQQKAKALAAQQKQQEAARRKAQLAAQQKAKALAAQQQQKAAAQRKAQLAARKPARVA
jgi:hypothetical protein